jgi:hypothetical protein
MAKVKKVMAKPESFTRLEVEAALCVWEWICEVTVCAEEGKDLKNWTELREGVGSAELRYQSVTLGQWCLKIYDICKARDEDIFDGMAYDWEVIPEIMMHAVDGDGAAIIYAEGLADPKVVADKVFRWAKLHDFTISCRMEARKQWAYEELISDHPERVEQSFDMGEKPADFVKWLGEKYDLTSVREWGGF